MARVHVTTDARTGAETRRLMTAAEEAALDGLTTIPDSVTRRQFFLQLTVDGKVNQGEARGAMQGAVAGAMRVYLMALPDPEEFGAEMTLIGEANFRRNDPVVTGYLKHLGLTAAQMDALFRAAARL